MERQWTLGEIVTALASAGLDIEKLREYPEQFWPQFPNLPEKEIASLPRTFSILARKSPSEGKSKSRSA